MTDPMADETRKAKIILDVQATGAKEAAQHIAEIRGEVDALEKAEKRAASQGASVLQKELASIGRGADLDRLGKEFGTIAGKTGEAGKSVADLTAKLKELGATDDEIKGVAQSFSAAQQAAANPGTVGERAQNFGSKLRGLPSVQIPGLGVGTDAIANIIRVGGALSGPLNNALTKLVPTAETAATATTALGAAEALAGTEAGVAAGGFGALAIALLPILAPLAAMGAAVAAVGLAIKSFVDDRAKESEKLNALINEQRRVGEEVARGAGSKELNTELQTTQNLRQQEVDNIARLQAAYDGQFGATNHLSGVAKALTNVDDDLATQIATSKKNVEAYDTSIGALNTQLGSAAVAANDAAEAAKAQTQANLEAAAAAGQEVSTRNQALKASTEQNQARLEAIAGEKEAIQAQIDYLNSTGDTSEEVAAQIAELTGQLGALGKESEFITGTALAAAKAREDEKAATKALLEQAAAAGATLNTQASALKASEEQNLARLDSIEEEKAAIQAQIDVLQASGNTSKEVTDQLAKLNAQLGTLGQESEFIKNTALEVSRQRDAEKKAKKDAEDAAKKAEAAQKKYTDSVAGAERTFKQAGEDIATKLRQGLADNLTDLFRDVDDIAQKYRRDSYDLDLKYYRDERDAEIDHQRDLEDVRRDANKDEQQAIIDGDFKQLFLARQKQQEAARDDSKKYEREKQDRQRAQQDARTDLLTDAQRARADRLTDYDRQNADARQAASRELAQAQLARQRSLSMASEAYSAELKQLGAYLQARNGMIARADAQALGGQGISGRGISGNGISGAGISGTGISAFPGALTTIGRVISRPGA